MKQVVSIVLVLFCICAVIWSAQANPTHQAGCQEHTTHAPEGHHQSKRNFEGLIDKIGSFFKAPASGQKSQAATMMGDMQSKFQEAIGGMAKQFGGMGR